MNSKSKIMLDANFHPEVGKREVDASTQLIPGYRVPTFINGPITMLVDFSDLMGTGISKLMT